MPLPSENAEPKNVCAKLGAFPIEKEKFPPSRSFEGKYKDLSRFWPEDSIKSKTTESNTFSVLQIGFNEKLSYFLINLPPPIS
ncbi:hypothetical protein [Leptospira borgpetersenii]|uniref:hypothetical protein n=1 Tax=Leptospira borgpetersenii TaxID=174 RepID=UPI00071D3D7F|nr:hypothetical protein [Leptospira borgpetersenii]MBE8161322.1 hypothetical protein [Leptospira borgpetersenii serovar Ballum]MBE8165718.1 hypothetical protein [Leptospira borgpetersenii serovar Ballum]MBE8200369.1 hypothetical protein [Leptospira borgpetersenii serovar Ballum]MBE8202719.1 hypothetical protein [Leptospira borgpetersenii serovar Ballum]MBE8223696.1 hypothetical protein [Leptospira borgpetersenii serovar Ballum]